MNNKQLTSEEANKILVGAAEASVERDVAIYAAARATGKEIAATDDSPSWGP